MLQNNVLFYTGVCYKHRTRTLYAFPDFVHTNWVQNHREYVVAVGQLVALKSYTSNNHPICLISQARNQLRLT